LGRVRLMQGNEACVEGALAANLRFFAGYPITPSSEIADILARRLPQVGGAFIQMEDEIASMAAVIGASLGGLKAMTATSGPGFSLKQENIGYAAITEVPCVVVNVQRVGPSTGMPTHPAQGDVMQARWGTHGDHPAVAFCPSWVEEAFHLTVRAFNVAEELRTPVILLMDEVVGHMRERVELPDPGAVQVVDRPRPTCPPADYVPYRPPAGGDVPPMADFGRGFRYHVTGLCHDETGGPTGDPQVVEALTRRLHDKVERRREELWAWEATSAEDAEVVLVAYGGVARSARAAVRLLRDSGVKAGLFRPVTIWPFPGPPLVEAAARARALVVAEMNLGQLRGEVERWVAGRMPVFGSNQVSGELMTPGTIADAARSALSAAAGGEGRC